MSARPHALYISPGFGPWLAGLGLDAHVAEPEAGIFDLPAYLDRTGFRPDVVIQDERLAPRVLVKGLWEVACPKVFWGMDPHLNHYWQGAYAAQFDLVLSTQKAWVEPLRAAGAPQARWLTWSEPLGQGLPLLKRDVAVGFVGRITQERPVRRLFADHLAARFGARIETDLAHHQVPGFYSRTRLAPDQAIAREITHRLFAASAMGALVIAPRADNGIGELFDPNDEVLLYDDVLELDDHIAACLADPARAHAKGLAAQARLAREHQPGHRLAALGRMALQTGCGQAMGAAGERLFWLGAARCLESGLLPGAGREVVHALGELRDDPKAVAARLRLMAAAGQAGPALELAARLAAEGFAQSDADFNLAAAALALKQGHAGPARWFMARLGGAGPAGPADLPGDPGGLWQAMAGAFQRLGRIARAGFPFDPAQHLPGSAVECLALALACSREDQAASRRLESLVRSLPGSEMARLALLSDLGLRNPADFRLGLDLSLANLQAYRTGEAFEELALALQNAEAKGRPDAFWRALAAKDPSGRVRAALARRLSAPDQPSVRS